METNKASKVLVNNCSTKPCAVIQPANRRSTISFANNYNKMIKFMIDIVPRPLQSIAKIKIGPLTNEQKYAYLNSLSLQHIIPNVHKRNEKCVGDFIYNKLVTNGINKFIVNDDGANNTFAIKRPRGLIHISHNILKLCSYRIQFLQIDCANQQTIVDLLSFCPNLIRLEIENFKKFSKQGNKLKRLDQLRSLSLTNCKLSQDLIEWLCCEHISNLEINYGEIADDGFLFQYFSNLQNFTMKCVPSRRLTKYMNLGFDGFLSTNKHLKYLKLEPVNRKQFDYIIRTMRQLEYLDWTLPKDFAINNALDYEVQTLKSVVSVKFRSLGCHWLDLLWFGAKYFPFMNSLVIQSFVRNQNVFNHANIPCDLNLSKLETLYLQSGNYDHDLELIFQYSDRLPNLTRFYVESRIGRIESLNFCFLQFPKLELLAGDLSTIESFNEDEFLETFKSIADYRPMAKIQIKLHHGFPKTNFIELNVNANEIIKRNT